MNSLSLYVIYRKIQKNKKNLNMEKAKGLAVCLAHDLENGWM